MALSVGDLEPRKPLPSPLQRLSIWHYLIALKQAVWIKTLIEELGFHLTAVPIYGDNQGAIFIASNAMQESCTKHIDIWYHHIRELMFVPGEINPANIFTKNLMRVKFKQFRNQMGLVFKAMKST